MNPKIVIVDSNSLESFTHLIRAHLEQYSSIDIVLSTFIVTCIVTSVFPRIGHTVSGGYLILLAVAALHHVISGMYFN
jgi:hypothetical protein